MTEVNVQVKRIHIGVLKGPLHRGVLQYVVHLSTEISPFSWRMQVDLSEAMNSGEAQ